LQKHSDPPKKLICKIIWNQIILLLAYAITKNILHVYGADGKNCLRTKKICPWKKSLGTKGNVQHIGIELKQST
jgi:hypothetical protein